MCTAWPPSAEHREDVAAHRVADHAEPLGVDVDVGEDPRGTSSASFSSTTSMCSKWWVDPGRLDLARLVDEVALGDQHEPVVAAEVGEHLGHVGQQPHRSRSSIAIPSVDELADDRAPGPRPRVTVIAASTIDSVNALTP